MAGKIGSRCISLDVQISGLLYFSDRGYRCLKVYRRTAQIFEYAEGSPAPREYQACSEQYFMEDRLQVQTLIGTLFFNNTLVFDDCFLFIGRF